MLFRSLLLMLCGAFALTSGAAFAADSPPKYVDPAGKSKTSFSPNTRGQSSSMASGRRADTSRHSTLSGETIAPFGSNLFDGNFARNGEDGIDPNYVISSGDKITVQTWGSLTVNEIFTVDGQGNIFIPEIGPVRVSGLKNKDLTAKVRGRAQALYIDDLGIYTNLLSTNPVGVYVTGFVNSPGRYAGIPSDGLLYFLDSAGGINPELGSYRHVEVLRGKRVIARADLYRFMLDGTLPNVRFREGDTIVVKKRGDVVVLRGDVAEPKLIEFRTHRFRGKDALSIIPEIATATEITLSGMRKGKPLLQTLPLAKFKARPLQNGDEILVRDDSHHTSMLINISGEFEGPSVLAVARNARLVDVLNHIPVNPEISSVEAIHIKRTSVAQAQKDVINDALYRLEKSSFLALSDTKGEAAIRVQEAELMSKFVERAKNIETLGRVVTSANGKQQNILLEPNDTIIIPARTNIVQVGGEVFLSQALVYNPSMNLKDYIEKAGGYTSRADKGKVVILRANGESITDKNAKVIAGDHILIPPRIDAKRVQNAMDFTEILYKIAISAGVIVGL